MMWLIVLVVVLGFPLATSAVRMHRKSVGMMGSITFSGTTMPLLRLDIDGNGVATATAAGLSGLVVVEVEGE